MGDPSLDSWNDGASKSAIVAFVARVTQAGGADFVPSVERIAVFDNDGTLWCEKPMPIEVGFILYVSGAEKSLDLAKAQAWTVVSMKNDWTTVFPRTAAEGRR